MYSRVSELSVRVVVITPKVSCQQNATPPQQKKREKEEEKEELREVISRATFAERVERRS